MPSKLWMLSVKIICLMSTDEWVNEIWCIFILEDYSSIEIIKYYYILQHRRTLNTSCHMKETRYLRPHITSFHLYEMSRTGKPTETGSRLGVARARSWGVGNGEWLPNGYRVYLYHNKNVQCSGITWWWWLTIWWIYLKPLNCTFSNSYMNFMSIKVICFWTDISMW